MKIVWDEPKRLANLEKHGFDFADVVFFHWHSAVIKPARPDNAGRRRMKAVDRIAVVIFVTLGNEAMSVISFRPASAQERKVLS
ncbi:hypothetical protein ASC75_01410 [Aminobacter sp. DSM 101952]|uniref:BrnT family toxin n=1 Tax=Aminobacter sp. DSM 101952 TaxID=2735891 RepID=UPI00070149FA|nr:BrnT family toxin [Aminobacter sp. DSM 101952]KQU76308.1 hypothetical protein ASC75_01410 [Aminobacter sp. DSM 101952]